MSCSVYCVGVSIVLGFSMIGYFNYLYYMIVFDWLFLGCLYTKGDPWVVVVAVVVCCHCRRTV